MFEKEERKRYFKIVNDMYEMVKLYRLDVDDTKIRYNVIDYNTGYLKTFNNVASIIQYLYDNHLTFFDYSAFSNCDGNFDYITIHVIADLETTIKQSVFEILKEFSDKKAPEFVQQLDNAILNGHITFKEYNELYKLTKVNGGKTL